MKYQQTQAILQAIEAELRRLQLWTELPPSAAALASQAPFCCDTMPLQQWLQYVLLPRMQALIDARLPLPGQISICPIAEEAFAGLEERAWPLINRIADLDELLSGRREQQVARV
ncbi:YqcC family protein [Rheinheimera sp.]|uniref:YqcC family protein n=1 Tax=Rheinheimera sp. TaxID=1869214 RepID=UPI003D2B7614